MSVHETIMQYYITNSQPKLNLYGLSRFGVPNAKRETLHSMSRGRGRGRGRGAAGLDAALPEDVKASWRGRAGLYSQSFHMVGMVIKLTT